VPRRKRHDQFAMTIAPARRHDQPPSRTRECRDARSISAASRTSTGSLTPNDGATPGCAELAVRGKRGMRSTATASAGAISLSSSSHFR
jgi:hypothetical protein